MTLTHPKYQKLIEYFKELGSTAIAFSGGVDSSFLLAVSKIALDQNTIGITIDSPSFSRKELEATIRISKSLLVKHVILTDDKIEDEIKFNPVDRCFFCKKNEFGAIIAEANKLGFNWVIDGSNVDDLKDYRPGQKAIRELQVKSPLVELGFTKSEIRIFSKELGLETWDKPAAACLYSRIPYGSEIKREDLVKVELSEDFLQELGFKQVRVRCHDQLSRIEIAKEDFEKLMDETLRNQIDQRLKYFGFKFVTFDVIGYRMGSFNETIGIAKREG